MESLYRSIGYSKQGYHQQVHRDAGKHETKEEVLKKVRATRMIYPVLGSRRTHKTARIEEMGITRFEQLMREEGLTIKRKRKWIKTTESSGQHHIYPNLTNGIKINGINELVAGDLTYLINSTGVYYIFLLSDVYSLRIVGWAASQKKSSWFAQNALERMVDLRGTDQLRNLIHHTDKGNEYRSNEYIGRLRELGIEISMAQDCIENGYAERMNGIIKNDFLAYSDCSSLNKIRSSLEKSIKRHEALPSQHRFNMSPIEFEQWTTSLPCHERPIVEMFDFRANSLRRAQMEIEKLSQPNQIAPQLKTVGTTTGSLVSEVIQGQQGQQNILENQQLLTT